MNIIDKIEGRICENKSSVKTYKDIQTANRVGEKLGKEFGAWNAWGGAKGIACSYIPVMLPNIGRWALIFNLSAWSEQSGQGTYLGWFAQKGHSSI